MSTHSVVHSTFVIERTYNAPPTRVFAAWANPASKRKWFAEGEGWEVGAFEADFRVGGIEHSRFRFKGGAEYSNDTVYQDIVPDQRIVLAYTMATGGKRFSASLMTLQLEPSDKGTRLVLTEQSAFFEGSDGTKMREQGWRELLEKLDEALRREM
jgi:uncharacterized protein YndB with AHSA1/START domain